MPFGRTKSRYEAVADIREHLAFYPSRVDAIEVDLLSTFSRSMQEFM